MVYCRSPETDERGVTIVLDPMGKLAWPGRTTNSMEPGKRANVTSVFRGGTLGSQADRFVHDHHHSNINTSDEPRQSSSNQPRHLHSTGIRSTFLHSCYKRRVHPSESQVRGARPFFPLRPLAPPASFLSSRAQWHAPPSTYDRGMLVMATFSALTVPRGTGPEIQSGSQNRSGVITSKPSIGHGFGACPPFSRHGLTSTEPGLARLTLPTQSGDSSPPTWTSISFRPNGWPGDVGAWRSLGEA